MSPGYEPYERRFKKERILTDAIRRAEFLKSCGTPWDFTRQGVMAARPGSNALDQSGRRLCGRPNDIPLVLAACLASFVRCRMRARSNSATPANMVRTIRPAGDVVSAQASSIDCNPASFSRVTSAMWSSSAVERASRSRGLQPRCLRRCLGRRSAPRSCCTSNPGRAGRRRTHLAAVAVELDVTGAM